ncbi:meiotically up-regulated gene 84 protein [Podospora fimiseda]|uniref:Meiotically up-regulated gene 84 protein n=1 Tax=Podospora fimiseda TaxID=252190 RepID=A0AAN7BXL7_9PEZI|nr:meiotically up-regulated gene 84 protein [Podospora fimiseda]
MSMTSEEDVEEDATPLSISDGDDRAPSQHDSSDSNHHDADLNGHLVDNNDQNQQEQEDRDNLSSNSLSGSEEDYDSDDLSDNDDENNHFPPNPQPFSQHTFAPPFYGRPPTPLPPSPSLTSLLRPSRPTTPDASDDEQHPGEPLPRARPKVPTYEYYGFVLYLFSSLSFLIYLLWSYLPSPFLHALGIDYYPNRWWSLAVPSFIVMLLVYIYVALAAYNVEILTLPMSSIETVVDQAAQVAVVDSRGRIKAGNKRRELRRREQQMMHWRDREKKGGRGERELVLPGGGGLNWKEVWSEGTDAVMDVPLAGVCEVLYGEWRDKEVWEGEGEEYGNGEDVITRI